MNRFWLLSAFLLGGCSGALFDGREAYFKGLARLEREPEIAKANFEIAKADLTEAVEAGDLKPTASLEARSMLVRCALELDLFRRADLEITSAADLYRIMPTWPIDGDRIGLHLIRAEIARRRSDSTDPLTSIQAIDDALTDLLMANDRVRVGHLKRYFALAQVRMLEEKGWLHLKHESLGRAEMIAQARRSFTSAIGLCREWVQRPSPQEEEFQSRLKRLEAALARLEHE